MLFLQAVDPISGGAGWVGAGLLGLLLGWLLLKHLPDKDAQIASIMDNYNGRLDGQRREFTDCLRQLAKDFREEAGAERQACERHFENLSGTISQAFRTLGDQLAAQAQQSHEHSARNQQWLEMLRAELDKQKGAAK